MRANRLGLTMTKRGDVVTLSDGAGSQAFTGSLDRAETWVAQRFVPKPPGPDPYDIPPRWRPWIDVLVTELRAAKRTPLTIELRVKRLVAFARAHPDSDPLTVTRNDLVKYLGDNNQTWTPEYAHSVRTTLRVFFGLLEDLEARPHDPSRRLPRIRIPRALPRPCPDGAVRAAMNDTPDPRMRLAIRLGAEAGLRRMEIAGLRRDAVEGWAGDFRIRLRGKGGHERVIPISDDFATDLRAGETDYLFPTADGHITPRHLGKMLAAALPEHWTAHTLRHRYLTVAYQATGDLRAVQELAGHASPATTAIYTKVADKSIRRAAMAAVLGPSDVGAPEVDVLDG